MAGFLDQYPLDWHHPALRELRDLLSAILFQPLEIIRAVQETGLQPGEIDWHGSASLQWTSVLTHASGQGRVRALLRAHR